MRIKSVLVTVMLATLTMFTACDDSEGNGDETSTIEIIVGGDTTNTDVVEVGDYIDIAYDITASAGIESIEMYRDDEVIDTYAGEIQNPNAHTYTYRFTGVAEDKDLDQVKLTLKVTDKDGSSEQINFYIYVERKTIEGTTSNKWEMEIDGTVPEGTGVSVWGCSTSTGAYAPKFIEADNQENIHFVYYDNKDANGGCIYSPSSAPTAIAGVFADWTVKNQTKFVLLTSDDYGSNLTDIYEDTEGASATFITNLQNGDVVGFITAQGKRGVIKFKEVYVNAAGTTCSMYFED